MTSLHLNAVASQAVSLLDAGGVVALPTDTLYALCSKARDAAAVLRVYQIKGREDGKPLPIFVSGLAMAEEIAILNGTAWLLARRFWPGQLTIVCHKQAGFTSPALAGGQTVALRQPDQPVLQAVIDALNEPLTGTSANLSGGPDPIDAQMVREQIGASLDLIVDHGPCRTGVSSTIVDCTGPQPVILRRGAVTEEQIIRVLAEAAKEKR